ncbi:MAG TPA: hypothetical protein VFR14_03245 [Candidatus Limnocylindrales bacterium]|nr:hypothetical protein [Candidatus Limnocylindrales bacterium]
MTAFVRVGGRGGLGDGSVVTWSVAEGRRGRRWREVRVADGAVISSLLLETDPDGRFSHTELSTAAGLLTLHPEGDGTIHGNTVGADGIGHVVGRPWDRDGLLLVEGSPIATIAAIDRLRARIAGGMTVELAAIVVGLDLGLTFGPVTVERTWAGIWRVGDGPSLVHDELGLPVLAEGSDWPLE